MRLLKMSLLTLLLFLFGLTSSQVLAEQVSEAIIGGDYAHPGHFKYQVSVEYGTHFCGGTIIAEQYILTAAHCVTEGSHIVYQPYKVIAGTHNLNDLKHAIIIPVETVYIHKQYHPQSDYHDVAILKLSKGLDLKQHANKIEKLNLPKRNYNLDNVDGIIAGFGVQSMKVEKNKEGQLEEKGGTTDKKLKCAHVTIYPKPHCEHAYLNDVIHESIFCAQVHQQHHHHYEGVCDGDSGSGLVRGHEVIGILTASPFACNETTRPAKYTRVGSYLTLINNVLIGKPGPDVAHANVPH